MRIGFETERLNRPPSGPKTYRTELGKSLLEVDDNIELVGFQFSDFHHELFEHPRVEKVVLPSLPGLIERQLSRLEVDILHIGAGLHRYPVLGMVNKKIVSTIHGIEPLVLEEYEVPLKAGLQKKYVWPQLARFLDQIIVVSNSAKKQLLAHYPVEQSAVTAIYNGIDHSMYEPQDKINIKSTLDRYEVQQPYFFSVGGYSHRKNPETLIKAFDLVAKNHSTISLAIAGPGWKSAEAEELIGDSVQKDRIHRLGKVPEKNLPLLYSGAVGFVSTTRHENFGIAIVEAMACGTPVIASRVYAVPEVTGDAGLLVDDPTDATAFASIMEELATNEDLQTECRGAGVERSHRFTWEQCAQETFEVYQDVQ